MRADHDDPSPGAHRQALLREAATQRAPQEAVVGDREFGVADMQVAGIPAFVVRLRKNCTARRRSAREFPATPADHITSWEEAGVTIRAEQWTDLVLPDAPANAPTFSVFAIVDPRYHDPLLLATPLPLSAQATRNLYRDRWPVEQLPLAAKQMIGAARQFVHEKETCQRLPELSLLAGSVLSYVAAACSCAAFPPRLLLAGAHSPKSRRHGPPPQGSSGPHSESDREAA